MLAGGLTQRDSDQHWLPPFSLQNLSASCGYAGTLWELRPTIPLPPDRGVGFTKGSPIAQSAQVTLVTLETCVCAEALTSVRNTGSRVQNRTFQEIHRRLGCAESAG